MLVQVVELFRCGIKRTSEEIKASTPLVGQLESAPAKYFNGRRELTFSSQMPGTYHAMKVTILNPLFGPHTYVIGENAMTIKGQQFDSSVDGQTRLYAQAWLVKFEPPDAKLSDPDEHPESTRVRSRAEFSERDRQKNQDERA